MNTKHLPLFALVVTVSACSGKAAKTEGTPRATSAAPVAAQPELVATSPTTASPEAPPTPAEELLSTAGDDVLTTPAAVTPPTPMPPPTPTPDQAFKLTSADCLDPDLAKVAVGTQLMLCDGTLAAGTYVAPIVPAPCAADGAVGCVAVAAFPAAIQARLLPENIARGVTIGGVEGERRAMQICKNGRGYLSGAATVYDAGNADSSSSVNDGQGDLGAARYTGAGVTNCEAASFTDVSAVPGSIPDATKNAGWVAVARDELSGVFVTNLFVKGGGFTWAESLALCKSLNGGTGGNGWHLPTLKELLQLHVDGMANVTYTIPTFGATDVVVVTDTTEAWDAGRVYTMVLSDGAAPDSGARAEKTGSVSTGNDELAVRCVR